MNFNLNGAVNDDVNFLHFFKMRSLPHDFDLPTAAEEVNEAIQSLLATLLNIEWLKLEQADCL